MGRFAGKTIVVTGSGKDKGLGQGILRRFADEGANCVVSDVRIDAEAENVATELASRGAPVATIACDVADSAQCVALAKVIVVNLSGAFYCTQAAARAMITRGNGGRIINIASQAAKTGFPHLPAYVSSKHGMIGLTRASAVELGAHGITVNAVCPNHVTTGLGAMQNEYFSRLLGFPSVDAYLANMATKNPMGRPGLPGDTAGACAFLASDDAFYITGEALNVSGGEEMH